MMRSPGVIRPRQLTPRGCVGVDDAAIAGSTCSLRQPTVARSSPPAKSHTIAAEYFFPASRLMNTEHDTAIGSKRWHDWRVRDKTVSMALTVDGSRTKVAVVLAVNGRVDGETAPELDRACHQWITAADRNLILDFSGVQYISSAGLSS